ncbi:MAG TPA: RNA polymerase sigma factor [Polyangia bacterium]|nr:RNA polymerase sigma factor [Polyangia bacterium]
MSRQAAALPEDLLAQRGWMRRLALHLVGDAAAADDVVQEAYVAALRHPPAEGRPVKPWLAAVLRNLARMRARAFVRSRSREEAVSRPEPPPTPETLCAQLELQHLLSSMLVALEEPYRSTILLHYHEGLSSAEIARRLGIEAATVRWRLKQGLDQLRARFDQQLGSRTWVLAMAQLGRGGRAAPPSLLTRARRALRHFRSASVLESATALTAAALVAVTLGARVHRSRTAGHARSQVQLSQLTPRPDRASMGAAERPRKAPISGSSPRGDQSAPERTSSRPDGLPRTLGAWKRVPAQSDEATEPPATPHRHQTFVVSVLDNHFVLRVPGDAITVRVDESALLSPTVQIERYGNTLRGSLFGVPMEVTFTDRSVRGHIGGPINLTLRVRGDELQVRGRKGGGRTLLAFSPAHILGYLGDGSYSYELYASGDEYVGHIGIAQATVRIPRTLAERSRGELAATLVLLLSGRLGGWWPHPPPLVASVECPDYPGPVREFKPARTLTAQAVPLPVASLPSPPRPANASQPNPQNRATAAGAHPPPPIHATNSMAESTRFMNGRLDSSFGMPPPMTSGAVLATPLTLATDGSGSAAAPGAGAAAVGGGHHSQ